MLTEEKTFNINYVHCILNTAPIKAKVGVSIYTSQYSTSLHVFKIKVFYTEYISI